MMGVVDVIEKNPESIETNNNYYTEMSTKNLLRNRTIQGTLFKILEIF